MKTSRFVRPDTDTLPISNGDTLTVRRRLSAGEQRAAFARMYRANAEGILKVDPLETGIATITAYLLDWTLTDESGALVVIRGLSVDELESVLNNLTPDDFNEIKVAIEAHVDAMDDARDQEKKVMTGEPASSATSTLPADVVGDTNGSPV